jgi:hypothetical protein
MMDDGSVARILNQRRSVWLSPLLKKEATSGENDETLACPGVTGFASSVGTCVACGMPTTESKNHVLTVRAGA